MSATPRPSQRKQATLTSFFTPKSSASSHAPSSSPSGTATTATTAKTKTTTAALPSRTAAKRPLEDAGDQNKRARAKVATKGKARAADEEAAEEDADGGSGRDRFARAVKRARGEEEDAAMEKEEEKDEVVEEEEDEVVENMDTAPTAASLPSSGRTRRYAYEGDEAGGSDAMLEAAAADSGSDDEATRREKAELHRRFVQKLGHPDSLGGTRRRDFMRGAAAAGGGGGDGGGEEEAAAAAAAEDDDDEEDEAPKKKKGKLTPMEQQFLAIKRQHMDTVLVVEVGYKFRFLGEDARTAARVLGIVCIPGKVRYDEHASEAHLERFASASIPVPRLGVHVRRLVAAGLKVGVVRQMETAALKKAGDNRNAPFERRLTSVYTKGTYVEDDEVAADATSSTATGYLLCLTETTRGRGTDETVEVGLLAVQPATGDIVYDSFADGFLRRELETRLLHLAPCELLLVGALSRASDKLVQHLAGSAPNVLGDRTRVERVPRGPLADAQAHVTQFYAERAAAATDGSGGAGGSGVDPLRLPENVTVCLSAMITHLSAFGLQHILALTKYFAAFATRQHMLLGGTTLESLEVYRNATDHGRRGSLLWALDKTVTRAGHRLLRSWLGRPLLDRAALAARADAVAELAAAAGSPRRARLERLLAAAAKSDLERSLVRIYYGKCARPELVAVLQALQGVSAESSHADDFAAPLLRDALAALPAIHGTVVAFLDKINGDAARRDDKYAFFREAEETEAITRHKMGIAAVELALEEQRAALGQALGRPPTKPPAYATVAGIEYLVEVPTAPPAELRRVPASWVKVSGTKRVARFHPPAVVRLLAERDQHKEALAAACDAAFAALLADIAAAYQPLRDAVAALAALDCLLSLARVAALPGYTRPVLVDEEDDGGTRGPSLVIRDGRHPVAEHTLSGGYIPFSVEMGTGSGDSTGDSTAGDYHPPALLVTGPNMGGKSSFVRAVALLTLLAQVGSFVPAAAMRLTPADALFTRMGARDNLFAGESTFMVEVSETAAILRAATPRSLVVLDELGRGTSTHDGAALAHAVLAHLARATRCRLLFITHYQALARVAAGLVGPRGLPLVQNVHMRFATSDQDDADGASSSSSSPAAITFLYEVAPGVAHRSYGLNVARLARIPPRVLDVAARKSSELEHTVRARRLRAAARLAADLLRPDAAATAAATADQLDHLVSSIEQL